MRFILALVPLLLAAQPAEDVKKWLEAPLLDPNQGLLEAQVYTAMKVPVVPTFRTVVEWDRYAAGLRQEVLDTVIFRGEAKKWRTAERRIEAMDVLTGPGYKVRKFRFEVLPGLWTPGVVYEPDQLNGKVPVVMNVNGHETDGISTPYIQERCINLAKRGIIAVNVEWIGRGQLPWDKYGHYQMNQLDLTGTSGLAVFYLQMERTLDLLLRHPAVDPQRVAVTGLSGGGWQTTFISGLDTRVKLSVPVAGHSSFVTRAQWPDKDLGDSEQTPSDLATVADYLHLSALVAPRPLLFINNAKDDCCFRADYAMGPLLQTTRGIYALYGAQDKLRYFINHMPRHNYGVDSREELYRVLRDEFGGKWEVKEIPSAGEVRTAAQLAVPLPADNATFQSLAKSLAAGLPREKGSRADLAAVVKAQALKMDAREAGSQTANGIEVASWRLRLGGSWTVPAVEMGRAGAREAVIVLGDEGRAPLSQQVAALLAAGKRVVAVDPFYFGESKMGKRDFLFAMQVAALGERPLGLQASQLVAVARWLKGRGYTVSLESYGRRTSLVALVAAALEPELIGGAVLHGSLQSLHQIIDENLTAEKYPEFFCFGLLEKFDIEHMASLGRGVKFSAGAR